jgi:hypothetical protein
VCHRLLGPRRIAHLLLACSGRRGTGARPMRQLRRNARAVADAA